MRITFYFINLNKSFVATLFDIFVLLSLKLAFYDARLKLQTFNHYLQNFFFVLDFLRQLKLDLSFHTFQAKVKLFQSLCKFTLFKMKVSFLKMLSSLNLLQLEIDSILTLLNFVFLLFINFHLLSFINLILGSFQKLKPIITTILAIVSSYLEALAKPL